MCMIIALMSFALAYSFYSAGHMMPASASALTGLLFAVIMARTIQKQTKARKDDDH